MIDFGAILARVRFFVDVDSCKHRPVREFPATAGGRRLLRNRLHNSFEFLLALCNFAELNLELVAIFLIF